MSHPISDLPSVEIFLNSDDADYNYNIEYNSNLVYFLDPPIQTSVEYDIMMRLENAVIPISFYLVSDENNDLNLEIGVNQYALQIPEGNYNALSLETQLNTLLNPYNITAVFDASVNQYTFTKSTATEFTFLGTSTCFRLLGFTRNQNHTSVALVLTSEFSINLSGSNLIYIDILNIGTRNVSSDTGGPTTIFKSIANNSPFGSILVYTNNTNSLTLLKDKYISYFHIRLLGDDQQLLNLHRLSWNITFELIFRKSDKLSVNSLEMLDVIATQEKEKERIRNLKK